MSVAAISAASSLAVFVMGAGAAQMALHPARLPVARVCPCLARMNCESVAIAAQDGVSLHGWYYAPRVNPAEKPSDKAIILLHGIGSNRQDMVPLGYLFLRQGYSVLEPDLRGHGESGGLTTYGVLEGSDIRKWVDWLEKAEHSSAIYGYGASLGGSVLLESLKEESRFRAVVAESPYSDFPSIAKERIARILPAGAKWVAAPFVDSGMLWARWHDGVDLRQASAIDAVRSASTPILVIHGLEDDRTSPDNSRRLAAARSGIQLWLVPGARHADAWKTAQSAFESRVLTWFRNH